MPHHHNVCLWPSPLTKKNSSPMATHTWWMFIQSFSEIYPLNTEILLYVFMFLWTLVIWYKYNDDDITPHKAGVNERIAVSQWLSLRLWRALRLAMTLTFDLWPCKPSQQWPVTWWIFVPSFDQIPRLTNEISCHSE